MIRVAAVGDLHFGTDSAGCLRPHLEHLHESADLLLIAGDLTQRGDPREAEALAAELYGLQVPVFAVLGNHDYHMDMQSQVVDVLASIGVQVLRAESATVEINGISVGIAGVKGFGAGFPGACCADFGEPEMKAFMLHSKTVANELYQLLSGLDTDLRIALLHYSPIEETLVGERLEIYPFLGSYLLAEAVDRAGADLVLHGHAHRGREKGMTPGGVHVRNVAEHVIRKAYAVFSLEPKAAVERSENGSVSSSRAVRAM